MPFDLLFHTGSDLLKETPSIPNSCSSPKRNGSRGYGEQSETEAIPVRNFHYFPLVIRESDLAILPTWPSISHIVGLTQTQVKISVTRKIGVRSNKEEGQFIVP
jgi:hypothetical protein